MGKTAAAATAIPITMVKEKKKRKRTKPIEPIWKKGKEDEQGQGEEGTKSDLELELELDQHKDKHKRDAGVKDEKKDEKKDDVGVDTFCLHMADRENNNKGKDSCRETNQDEPSDKKQTQKRNKLLRVKLLCKGLEGKLELGKGSKKVSKKGDSGEHVVRVLSDREDVGFKCTGGEEGKEGKDSRCVFTDLNQYSIKERLVRHWSTLYDTKPAFADGQQAAFFTAMHQYKNVANYQRDPQGGSKEDRLTDAVLLHCVNHIMKTSDLVKKGNGEAAKSSREDNVDPQRDQGFTRPKVLVLFPFRKFAYNFIERLMKIVMLPNFGKKHLKSISGGQQFLEEYGSQDQEDLPDSVKKELKKPMQNKPKDFQNLFDGNSDDHFRMGIKLTKSSVKLFSDFYKSDIIVASPLGLITLINDAERSSDKSYEFLSSIEIFVVDFADVLMMQNWEHVLTVMSHMNQIPASSHNTDIMRIREWYLAGHAKKYLQSIVLSSYATAELNSFIGSCSNFEGLVKFPAKIEAKGVIDRVMNPVKQLYIKHAVTSVAEESDSKMVHFEEEVLNKVLDSFSPGILIFVRSYFDFVRLRKKLDEENANFVALSEYTERSQADRYRSLFANGTKRILLYSERAQFYFRYRFRGIRDIIFYSLPDHAHFYSELLNMIDTSSIQQPTATIMFSKYDNMQLSRIVGPGRAKEMMSSETDTFMLA